MVIDWHDDDVKAHERIDSSLLEIHKTLTVMRTERKFAGWAVGVLVPAVVALFFTGVAHALGW
jgi:hypothetical protein